MEEVYMREIKVKDIALVVENMLIDACQNIPENVLCALRNAKENENHILLYHLELTTLNIYCVLISTA